MSDTTPKAEVLKNKGGETFSPVTHAKAVKHNSDSTLESAVINVENQWKKFGETVDTTVLNTAKLSPSSYPISEPDNSEYVFATQIEAEHEKATIDSTTGAHGIHKSDDGTKLIFTDKDNQDWNINLKTTPVEHKVSPIHVHAKNGILPPVSSGSVQNVSSEILKLYPKVQTAVTDNSTWRELGYLNSKEDGSDEEILRGQTSDTTIHYTMSGYGDCVGFFPEGSGSPANSIDKIIKTYNRYNITTPAKTESEITNNSVTEFHNVTPLKEYFKEFDYTAAKSIPYVALYWTDPDDTDTFKWKETRVVRKLGTPPVNADDGILVAYTHKDDPRGFGKNRFSSESSAVLDFEYPFNKEYNSEWESFGKDSEDNSMIMYYRWFVIDETGYVYPNENSTSGKYIEGYPSNYDFNTSMVANSYFGEYSSAGNDVTDNSLFFRNCTRVICGGVAINSQPAYPQRCSHGGAGSEKNYQRYSDTTAASYDLGIHGTGYFATYIHQNGAITFTTTNRFSSSFQGHDDDNYSPHMGYHEFNGYTDSGYTSATLNSIFESLMIPVVVDQEGNLLCCFPRGKVSFIPNISCLPASTLPIESCYKAWNCWDSDLFDNLLLGANKAFLNPVSRGSSVESFTPVSSVSGIYTNISSELSTAIKNSINSAREAKIINTARHTVDAYRISTPEIWNKVNFMRAINSSGKSLDADSVTETLNKLFTVTNSTTNNWYYARTSNNFDDVYKSYKVGNTTYEPSMNKNCVEYPSEDSPLILSPSCRSINVTGSDKSDTSRVVTIAPGESLQFEVMLYMPLMYYKITPLDLQTYNGAIDTGDSHSNEVTKYQHESYSKVLIELSSEPLHGFKIHPAFIHYTNTGTKDSPILKKTIVPYILMSPWSGTIMESDSSSVSDPGVSKRFTGTGVFTDPLTNYINPARNNYKDTDTSSRNGLLRANSSGDKIYYPAATLIAPTKTSTASSADIMSTGNNMWVSDTDTNKTEQGSTDGYCVDSIWNDNTNTAEANKFISIAGGLPFCTPTCITGVVSHGIPKTITKGDESHVSREIKAQSVDLNFKTAIKNKGKDWHMPTLSSMELIRLYYLCEYGTLDKFAMMHPKRGAALVGEGAITVAEYATEGTQTWKKCNDEATALDTTTTSTHLPPLTWLERRQSFLDYWHKSANNPDTLLYTGYMGSTDDTTKDPGKGGLPISLYSKYYVYAPFTTLSTGVHFLQNWAQSGWNLVKANKTRWKGSSDTTYCSATEFWYLSLSYHGFDLNNLGLVDNSNWDSSTGFIPILSSNNYIETAIWNNDIDNVFNSYDPSSIKTKYSKIETIPNDSGVVYSITTSDAQPLQPDFELGYAFRIRVTIPIPGMTPQKVTLTTAMSCNQYRPIQYTKEMDWTFIPGNFATGYAAPSSYVGLFFNTQSHYPQRGNSEQAFNTDSYLYYSPKSLMLSPNTLRDTYWATNRGEDLTDSSFSFSPESNEAFTSHIEYIPSPRVDDTSTNT